MRKQNMEQGPPLLFSLPSTVRVIPETCKAFCCSVDLLLSHQNFLKRVCNMPFYLSYVFLSNIKRENCLPLEIFWLDQEYRTPMHSSARQEDMPAFTGNSYSLSNVLWLAMDSRLGRKNSKPHRLITSRQCSAMVNQPRLIDFSESTKVHMGTDVNLETETILDYFSLITNLLESPRFPSESSASPQTVRAHQSAIQLPIHLLTFQRNREEAPRMTLCTWWCTTHLI